MSRERNGRHEARGAVNLLVPGQQTQGRFALVEVTVRPAEEPPLHTHTLEDEVIYVVRGEITVYLDGHAQRCTAGECVLLPKGIEHTYCIESEEATLLILLMPAGFEDYYLEMDRPVEADRYVERLIATSARFGLEIGGPAPSATHRPAAVLTHDREGEDVADQEGLSVKR